MGKLGMTARGAAFFAAFVLAVTVLCQSPQPQTDAPHQMIMTGSGFIAIDLPKGWEQREGPGLAYFYPEGVPSEKADVWMYISSAPVGPKEEDKDPGSYIQSDIAGFKQHFKNATVRREDDLTLAGSKQVATVYSFLSGEKHNAYEQVVYIPDAGRVLLFVLCANKEDEFKNTLRVFQGFVTSYRGSIQMGEQKEK